MLTCVVCEKKFTRKGTRGPIPKYCSQRCKTKAARTPHRRAYEREYRRTERLLGKRRQYEFEYNRRPNVRERNRKRMLFKWHNDPEWREREKARMRTTIYPEIVVPRPYTGHRWLDMAANIVGTGFDETAPWADDKWDDIGEAVLALLEGRDMKEAVRNYRKKEYAARNLTVHLGDWGDDEDEQNRWFEKVMPQVESAEDEALANESVQFYAQTRFNNVSNKSRRMKHKTQQPSRRRMNNGKGWRRTGEM